MESTKNNKKCSRVQVLTKGDRIVCRSTRNITRDDSDSPQSAHCPAFSGNLDLSLICCVRVTTSLSLLFISLGKKDVEYLFEANGQRKDLKCFSVEILISTCSGSGDFRED